MDFASFVVMIIAFAEYLNKLLLKGSNRIGIIAFDNGAVWEKSWIGLGSSKSDSNSSRLSIFSKNFKTKEST